MADIEPDTTTFDAMLATLASKLGVAPVTPDPEVFNPVIGGGGNYYPLLELIKKAVDRADAQAASLSSAISGGDGALSAALSALDARVYALENPPPPPP